MNVNDILGNRPTRVVDPEHPCYGFASVVNGEEVALHKTEISAVVTAIGGRFITSFADILNCSLGESGRLVTDRALDFYHMGTLLKRIMGEEEFESLMTLMLTYEEVCAQAIDAEEAANEDSEE
jgi:hypothetical protein